MNLVYYKFGLEMEIFCDKTNCLTIEHPSELEQFVISLMKRLSGESDQIDLMEALKKLDMGKEAEFILSPMDLVYRKKELQKRLYECLEKEVLNSDLADQFAECSSAFLNFMDEVRMRTEYEIDFDEGYDLSSFFKSFDVHLSTHESSFAEKLIDFSKNMHRLLGRRVFFLLSCAGYMNAEDFMHLEKHAMYEKIYFVFVESRQIGLNREANELIIDKDLCELR